MGDHPTDDLLPGFLLDRYRVEEVVGETGCHAALRAFDTRTKRMVLVKVLKHAQMPDRPDDYRLRKESFIRAVDAAARTGFHSHLVAVLDFVDGDGDTLHLVLEYVPGGDLATLLSRGPLPAGEALRIAADAAAGLHAAHETGVVHCDIRPQNIFLAHNTRAKVGNFGRARFEGDAAYRTALAPYLGSPLYLSPEQENFLRPTTDQYSLGLVLLEMLTDRTYKGLPEAEAEGLITGLPAEVGRVVRRMLARHPDERYATMGEVAKELTALLDDLSALPSAREVVALVDDRPPALQVQAKVGVVSSARSEPPEWLRQAVGPIDTASTGPEGRTWDPLSAPDESPSPVGANVVTTGRVAAAAESPGVNPHRAWREAFRGRKTAHAGPVVRDTRSGNPLG